MQQSSITAKNYIGATGIFARETTAGTDYMLKSGHGDVASLVKNGIVAQTYDYDAYGVEKNPNENDTNPFRYCGEYFDDVMGHIYLRNRYYAPNTGRFITEDPIRDGLNWYVYCGNSPILFIDPFGCHDLPVIENNQTIDVRFDLRFLLNRYNGVLKYDEETKIISMKAFGVEAEIKSTDYTLVDDHVHVTFGEFLDIFNVEYECEKAVYSVDEKGVMKQKFHIRPIVSYTKNICILYWARLILSLHCGIISSANISNPKLL